uniref:SH3 domain-containing protein n=1 Tax=Seriola lalandi dorsalis TaxID=1841481 RepID=A0A3B4WE52_SERLL
TTRRATHQILVSCCAYYFGEDELTFSQGDVIALLELMGQEWGRGQIHGRVGVFPLNFAEVVEPLPQPPPPPSPGETTKSTSVDTAVIESSGALKNLLSLSSNVSFTVHLLSVLIIIMV